MSVIAFRDSAVMNQFIADTSITTPFASLKCLWKNRHTIGGPSSYPERDPLVEEADKQLCFK
jgi:hypothetical protein